ncbi:MAG: cobalt-precorrin-5B (C(1))-methyltransferase CbiD, partial [Deltaproteobacteria bacterium]
EAVTLPVHRCEIGKNTATASVIKDAGDDPDVTNGAEIIAEIQGQGPMVKGQGNKAFQFTVYSLRFTVYGGKGVGIVTKPGLAIPIGEPAINPVPRKMIEGALRDAITNYELRITKLKSQIPNPKSRISVVISVPDGEEIAKKTMNARLGITGGISILGTTGIVEPLSLSAYRHSIVCALDVAVASGCREIVFSTGRSSEKAAEKDLMLPEEAFILVGDHMGFALKEVRSQGPAPAGFKRGSEVRRVTIVGQFGKFSKLAAGHFETHCSDSSIELKFLANLAKDADANKDIIESIRNANTARQVFFILKEQGLEKVFRMVCKRVKENSAEIAGIDMGCMLVGYNEEVVVKL